MRFRKIIICFCICTLAHLPIRTFAQDVHFSQFTETPQLLNPGATGVYNGYMRAIINYKNQWGSMGNSFKTMAASFDIPMFDYNERKAHIGAGINFFNDRAGDAGFGLTEANICVAAILPVSKSSKFSFGVSVGGAQHKANLAALTWGNQYDGDGFDPLINSYESTAISSFVYADLGAGLYYEWYAGKATLDRNENKSFAVGLAYFHLNQPTQKYFSITQKLYGKMVGTLNGSLDVTGSRVSVLPSAMFAMQGPSTELTFGCAIRIRLKNGTKTTGFIHESGIAIGLNYRLKDAFIPAIHLEVRNFALGVSYDLNLSNYKKASAMKGGIEVSLKYYIAKGALFKQKNIL